MLSRTTKISRTIKSIGEPFFDSALPIGSTSTQIGSTGHNRSSYDQGDGLLNPDERNSATSPADTLAFRSGIMSALVMTVSGRSTPRSYPWKLSVAIQAPTTSDFGWNKLHSRIILNPFRQCIGLTTRFKSNTIVDSIIFMCCVGCVGLFMGSIACSFAAKASATDDSQELNCKQIQRKANQMMMPIINKIALHGNLADVSFINAAFDHKIKLTEDEAHETPHRIEFEEIPYVESIEYGNYGYQAEPNLPELSIFFSYNVWSPKACPSLTMKDFRKNLAGSVKDERYLLLTPRSNDNNSGIRIKHFLPMIEDKYWTDVIWSYQLCCNGVYQVINVNIVTHTKN